jgi:hypothetical protein
MRDSFAMLRPPVTSVRIAALIVCIACIAALWACGSKSDDANQIVVATVTRCSGARPATPRPDLPLSGRRAEFFSKHPLAQLENQGGRTLDDARIVAVFFGEDKMRTSTEALLQSFGCTQAWRDSVGEYGIGDALFERSITMDAPPPVAAVDLPGFESWIAGQVTANAFGPLTSEHLLLFFLPPDARLETDDCSGRLGGHSSVATTIGNVAYAYFDVCSSDADPKALADRTHTVSHELMEMATDPDALLAPAWKTLGPGLVAPSLRPSESGSDDEGADFCNDVTVDLEGYPFEVAASYSNRLARAGMNPCSETQPMGAMVALATPSPNGQDAIDLSSGHARVTLDVFDEDPSEALSLTVVAEIGNGDIGVEYNLTDKAVPTRDGDLLTVDLNLVLHSYDAMWLSQASYSRASFIACSTAGINLSCARTRIPISGLPPIMDRDGGASDGD